MTEMFAFLLFACHATERPTTPEVTPPGAVLLQPVATARTSSATVPGPPAGCVAKFFVRVPKSACPDDTDPWLIRGEVSGAAAGATCHLSCSSREKHAQWAMFVPTPGFRGDLTCVVEGVEPFTFVVGDPASGFSDAAGATWLSSFGGDSYLWDMRADIEYITAKGCPSGQPSRGTASAQK